MLLEQLVPDLGLSLQVEEAVDHLNSIISGVVEGGVSAEAVSTFTQKQLCNLVNQAVSNNLQAIADSMRDKARLGSVGLPHAGDWLNVVPCPSLGLQLRPSEFKTAVLYRLGLPVFDKDGPCIGCRAPSDKYGDHAVGCASQGERCQFL